MKRFVAANAKAITAVVMACLAWLLLRKGVQLPEGLSSAIGALLTGILVWGVPNTPRPPPPPEAQP